MAEQDLNFTAGLDTGPFMAEVQRLLALMRDAAASMNFQQPFDAGAQAARRAAQDFRAVDLSLANIARSARSVGDTFGQQEVQLRKVEAAIRTIRNLPLVSQQQFTSLTQLEAIRTRLRTPVEGSVIDPQQFQAVQTAMARFTAELKAVQVAQDQVTKLGKTMTEVLRSRVQLDPSLLTSLAQLREQIGLTGPMARSAFNDIIRGAQGVVRAQEGAAKSALDYVAAQKGLQAAGQSVARGEQEMARAIQARAAAQERASQDYERALVRQANLLQRLARLPQSPARDDLFTRTSGAVGQTEDPRALNALNREFLALRNTATDAGDKVEGAGKKIATTTSLVDKLTTRLGTHLQIVASIGVAYTAFNALTAVVQHVIALDQAMHRISATIDDQQDRSALLARSYGLIQRGMTQFGLSTEDAGKLVLELSRSLSDLTKVNAAFEPALALTVRGEVNMADATHVLIGAVNAFGTALLKVDDPLQAYGAVADKIIRASNLSVGSIGTFSSALTNLAGRASVTNVTFDETLALLSLVQDSLGRAGQSGTGLARVFEGLLLRTDQLAEVFQIDFDPLGAVKPIELLTQLFAKLNKEIALTGGISSETEAKIQRIVGTELGTKQIELLTRAFPQFAERLRAIADSSGQHLKELKEHNEQLGVSFKNLTNSALVAFDSILLGFSKVFGGGGGTPGEFSTLAQAFNAISAGALAFGASIGSAGEKIQELRNALANLQPPPDWLSRLIGAPAGSQAAGVLDQIANDIGKVGKELSVLPEPPDWLMRMLGFGASVAIGGLLLGPVGAVAGGGSFLLTQYSLDAEKAKQSADALKKSAEETARALTTRNNFDPAAISDQASQAAVAREEDRNRKLAERATLMDALSAKIERDIRQRNVDLSLEERIRNARDNAAKSTAEYREIDAKIRSGFNAGEKDRAAAIEEASRIGNKAASDRLELQTLENEKKKKSIEQDKELAALAEKRAEALRGIQRELEKAQLPRDARGAIDVIAQANLAAIHELADARANFAKQGGEDFAAQYEHLIRTVVATHKDIAYQAIAESLIAPYRDATQVNNELITKLVVDTNAALAQLGTSLTDLSRAELIKTPTLAIDKQIGLDKIQADLRAAQAILGVFGDAAVQATQAASRGFASWDAMIEAAGDDLSYLADDTLPRLISRFRVLNATTAELSLKQVLREIEVGARALDAAFDFGLDPVQTEANIRAIQRTQSTLAELRVSADATKRALADALVVGVKQDATIAAVDSLNKQLIDLTKTNASAATSFGLMGAESIAAGIAFELMSKGVDVADKKIAALIGRVATAIQQQKALENIKGLIAIGFSETAARDMAASIALQAELNAEIDSGTAALKSWNDQSEATYQRQLSLIRETARQSGDIFTFLQASFAQATSQGHTFWDDLETMTKNAASNMASSVSDIFFALFQNKLEEAKAAVKNFFLGLLREITNFMSTQGVKSFMNMFAGPAQAPRATQPFNTVPGAGPVGTGISIGVSSPEVLAAAGYSLEDFTAQLENSVTVLQFANSGFQTITGQTVAFASILDSVMAGWAAGEGIFGGISSAASSGFTALETASASANGVSVALAGVGAALAIFDNIMTGVNGNMKEFGLRAGLGIAGGVIGGVFFNVIGAFVGIVLGDLVGRLLSNVFGFEPKMSNYDTKRMRAANQAFEGSRSVVDQYSAVSRTTDTASLFNAIKTSIGGAGTILMVSPEMASRLGIDVSKYGPGQISEGKFEVSWSDVTQAQFDELLRELAKDPAQATGLVAGRINVPYLPQDQVEEFQKGLGIAASALLEQFVNFRKLREEIVKLNTDIADAIKDFLPPDVAQHFKANILDPIGQSIFNVLTNPDIGLEEAKVKLAAYEATIKAYVGMTDLYGQVTQDLATHTGNFVDAMIYADTLIERARRAADVRVTQAARDVGAEGSGFFQSGARPIDFNADAAIAKVREAFANLDLTPIQAFERLSELRAAVLSRFELEKKLVLEAETDIAKLYDTHKTGMLQLDQAINDIETSTRGTSTHLNGVIASLLEVGTTSLSVSERIYTVNAALNTFLAALPSMIQGVNVRPGDPSQGQGGLPVDQILEEALKILRPFIDVMNQGVRDALAAGDFDSVFSLLRQLGQSFVQVMNTAIAGVRQWEQQQIDSINRQADAAIRAAGLVRDSIQAQYDQEREGVEAQIDAIDAQRRQIQLNRDAANDYARMIRDLMKPYEDQLKAISRQQDALRRSMRPLDDQIRAINDAMKPISNQIEALNNQAELLRQNADEQLDVIRLQSDALNDQRKTIEDQIELIEEFANAVLSVREYLQDLALSGQAPPDSVGQFQIAKTSFDALFRDFKASPDAGELLGLQDAASDLLASLGVLFERPSAEYRDLYDQIVRKLEKAARIGEGLGSPADLDDLNDQLTAIDTQLEALNTHSEEINRQLELQLHAIELQQRPLEEQLELGQSMIDAINDQKDGIQRQIELLEDTKQPIQDLLTQGEEHLELVNDYLDGLSRQEEILGRQEVILQRDLERIANASEDLTRQYTNYIDGINKLREDAVDAVKTTADENIKLIRDTMLPLIQGVATSEAAFFEWMRTHQYARLLEITNGQGGSAWMRAAQESAATDLGLIQNLIDGFLRGDMKTIVSALTTPTTDQQLVSVLGDVSTTMGNLDSSIRALNTQLGEVPYQDPNANVGGGGPYAAGSRYIHQGTYKLDEGEMVVPSAQAEALRATTSTWSDITRLAEGGGGNIYISIAPVIHSNQNPTAIVNQAIDRIVTDIRGGGAIQDAIARMPKRSR